MQTKDFWYELPQDLIAQHPVEPRDISRLLVLDRKTGQVRHRLFHEVLEYLKPGDCLVVNNTRVIPARLLGEKEGSGGKMEFVLLKRLASDEWEVLVKPGRKARVGARFLFGGGLLKAEVMGVMEEGNRRVRFTYEGVWEQVLDKVGIMPLPPYITATLEDRERYQTVYSRLEGSAAAPTAGLHFTLPLLDAIRKKGVTIAEVTLHVGLGTFRPVKVEQVETHRMHSETFTFPKEACEAVLETRRRGGRIIAVGTTSVRVLETVAAQACLPANGTNLKDGMDVKEEMYLEPQSGETAIFIYPGHQFLLTDGLITNFHLPESTLMMLVSALAGREHIMQAYQAAVEERYRFFSFGDAMLILPESGLPVP